MFELERGGDLALWKKEVVWAYPQGFVMNSFSKEKNRRRKKITPQKGIIEGWVDRCYLTHCSHFSSAQVISERKQEKKQWEFSNTRERRKAAKIDKYSSGEESFTGEMRERGGLFVFLFTTGASG